MITGILLFPVIYNCLVVINFKLIFYENHPVRDFNQESRSENIHRRHEMSTVLVENGILTGKRKFEIIEMLGSPNSSQGINDDGITI